MRYWGESLCGLRWFEYKDSQMFATTAVGGIFAQPWSAELANGAETIEGSYPPVATQSYKDGGRLNNQVIGNSNLSAVPTDGPFSSYHWTAIQLDGGLSVIDVYGNKLTIAGYKADPTLLPLDYVSATPANPEFPNTVQVGTISSNPANTFSDFGGGPNDVVWDPRDPYICYICQPLDHCIIVCNFHSNSPYGPSNPLCYRYAGYKGGVNGNGVGGYVDGPALGTVTGGVQATATFTGSISDTTLTVRGVTGTIGVGQYLCDGGAGHIIAGTYITGGSGSSWTVNNSQTVSSETMYTNDGAQLNGPYSIQMQKRTDVPGHPQGTMYVADNYNCLIRVIAPTSTPGVAGAVSTLVGAGSGGTPPVPFSPSGNVFTWVADNVWSSNTITASSYSNNGDGTTAVVLRSTPPTVPAIAWKVIVYVDGSLYNTGSSLETSTYAIYPISAFTNGTNFSIAMPYPGAGHTVAVEIRNADKYSSPTQVSFAKAYTILPQVLRMTSAGDIVGNVPADVENVR